MTTSTQVSELKINKLTKQQYEGIQNPSPTELYFVTDDSGITSNDVTTALGYTPQNSATAVTHTASTAVGNSTTPVYINSSGVATALSYSLAKSVPADAVFTDTTYSAFTGADGSSAGTSGLVPAPTATDNTKFLKGDGTWASPAGVTVDQSYDPTSANAQSGVAIAGAGFITGINSSDVTTALGYTPYDSSNPSGYTSNVGTVTKVNNTSPDSSGNVSLTIPTTTDSITSGSSAALTSGGAYTNLVTAVAAHSTDANKINVTKAGSTSTITINDVAHATSADSATSATTASKLGSADKGSATQPIYLSGGTPTACTYSLAKSVPADAVFTDTTYSAFIGADGTTAGTSGLVPQPSATDNTKYLKGDGTWATPPSATVDQSYDPTSANAQSGVAIAGAGFLTQHQDISGKMDNTNPTGTGSFSLNRKSGSTVGTRSVAICYNTSASGQNTFAAGNGTSATGDNSFVAGYQSQANAGQAVAFGRNNIAGYTNQTVVGKYNNNKSSTVFEVGWGTSTDVRSNAFEVYQDGTISTDNGTTKVKLENVVTSVNNTAPVSGNVSLTIPTTTDSVTSGSSAALTSGGAYTNVVRRLSSSAATGSASQGVYVDASGQVQACDAVTSTYSSTGTAPVNGTAVKSAIDSAISSVYKPAGSIAFANRPTLSASVLGNVYNITDDFTTTADFVEGAGKKYSAGTNIVVINTGTSQSPVYKFDVLGNFVDLSGYQLAETAVTHTKNTAAGDSTTPVYINSSGVATALSYTIAKSVPSDAVFTDTTYSVFTGANGTSAGTAGLVKAPAATDNTKYLKGDGTWATVDALPTQTGNSGKYLTTNGSAASWVSLSIPTAISDLTDDTATTPIDKADYATSAGTASSATTASTLGSADVGSATQGIYLDDGTPKACTYTVSKSVPSDAVFTDTDTKVTQNVSSTNSTYPILLCPTANATTNQGATTSIFASGVKVNPSTKTITATTFDGNATTATTASKLGSADKGSATQPIYLSGGTPTACTYTLAKSVPSDAVFTDTTYSVFTGANGTTAGTAGLVKAPGATDNTKFLKGDGTWATPPSATVDQSYSSTSTNAQSGTAVAQAVSGLQSASTAVTHTASTSVGDSTTPVYIASDGTATALSYTIAKSVPSNAVFTDTNTLMTQNVSSTDSTYPILLCPTANATANQGAKTGIFASGVKVNPSTSTVSATTFSGNLTGNVTGNVTGNCSGSSGSCTGNAATATSATTASKLGSADVGSATQGIYLDDGTPKACTYTVSKSVPSDAVFTDTNTLMTQNVSSTNATYPILLCPTANATANQGAKTGIFASGVKVNPSTSTISATFSGNLTGNVTGNVTGNCSGSSGSCTGNAATATSATSADTASKLGSSNVGSATQPIYLSAGTATACTYTLGKSVPSDAVFTDNDTKYTAGSSNSTSKLFLVGATAQGTAASNAQAKTTYSNSAVYEQNGYLYATTPAATTNDTTVATTKFVKDQGYTSNAGTITGITMNGSSMGTSGVVDLGTVITSHQDITGKANTSMNNLSSDGKLVIDGIWTIRQIDLITSSTVIGSKTTKEYTITPTNIPADGQIYEVLWSFDGQTSATSGQTSAIYVGSDLINVEAYRAVAATPRTNAAINYAACGTMLIGTDRKIKIRQSESYNTQINNFRIYAIRRIGTNPTA